MASQTSCSNEQKVACNLAYTTLAGNPARVDGPTEFTVVSGDGSFERLGDGSGFLVSGSATGDTVFDATADVDLGAGVVTLTERITLSVGEPQAANVGVVFGAPVPK